VFLPFMQAPSTGYFLANSPLRTYKLVLPDVKQSQDHTSTKTVTIRVLLGCSKCLFL
jgi:hypothetical protein